MQGHRGSIKYQGLYWLLNGHNPFFFQGMIYNSPPYSTLAAAPHRSVNVNPRNCLLLRRCAAPKGGQQQTIRLGSALLREPEEPIYSILSCMAALIGTLINFGRG